PIPPTRMRKLPRLLARPPTRPLISAGSYSCVILSEAKDLRAALGPPRASTSSKGRGRLSYPSPGRAPRFVHSPLHITQHPALEYRRKIRNQLHPLHLRHRHPSMLNMLIRPQLHRLENPEPARIQRLQIRLRKHAVHPKHPLDRNIKPGLLLNLANQAILKTLPQREMPSRQIPTPGPIRHPRRAPKHQNPPAIRDHAMNPDIELLLRHEHKLPSLGAYRHRPHPKRIVSS